MAFLQTFERGIAALMALLKFEIGDYCDLESVEVDDEGGGAVVGKDGSMATIVKYEGFKTLMSSEDFNDAIERLTLSAQSYLGTKGHQIQVVFDREIDSTEEMGERLAACYQTAKRLQIDAADLLDESKTVLNRFCCAETVYFVLWTRPSLLQPIETKLYRQEQAALAGKVPPMKDAQNPLRTIRFLVDKHDAFVNKFTSDIRNMRGSARVLDVRPALCEVRRSLFRAVTPPQWSPTIIGDAVRVRWQDKPSKDVSAAMPQPLAKQLVPLDAFNGSRKGSFGVTDTRAVRIGGRIYAPCYVSMFPMKVMVFDSLFRDLNAATTRTKSGVKPMPWRVSFMIEGDGLSGMFLRKVFAGILGLSSESNRNLVKAANVLSAYKHNGAVVKVQINAATWVDYGEEKELMLRRSKLVRSLSGWGDANVNEETGDPTAGMASCALGLTYNSIATETAVPLEDVLTMLPITRPTSPFSGGHVLFRTRDGKLLPYEMFSAEQTTWITLLFAGPGKGKSVLLNRLNVEMCWAGGLARLPFICIIDIGISSSGFISLIRENLPPELQHLCLYTRLQNTAQYTVNPFDTMLGCRIPLERERDYMANFLTMLATPPESAVAEKGIRQFAGLVVDAMFRQLSDENERGTPREYTHGADPVVTKAVDELSINYNDTTKWWTIVDALFQRGALHAAYCAQRYAMPTLTDAVRAAADPAVVREFDQLTNNGISVPAQFRLMISSAIAEYPIFAGQTVFDVGEARLMAIDLNDVVTTGSAAAKRKAALMYMTARNLFIKKIAISEEDLPYLPATYRPYHTERFNEIKEDYKRLGYDEFHKTGGDPMLGEQAMTDGREGRKWGLEVILASQLPQDFKGLSELATTILILDAGNVQTRRTIKETFGLSDAELSALVNHVHGPAPDGSGATFLAKFSTTDAEYSQLFTSTMGPQMLWGLATGKEDRVVRDILYKRLGAGEARRALAWRFPTGSCHSYVGKLRQRTKSESSTGWVDDDATTSILQKLATEVYEAWIERKEKAVEDVAA